MGFISIQTLKKGDCFFNSWSEPCVITKVRTQHIGPKGMQLHRELRYYMSKHDNVERITCGDLTVYPISKNLYDIL